MFDNPAHKSLKTVGEFLTEAFGKKALDRIYDPSGLARYKYTRSPWIEAAEGGRDHQGRLHLSVGGRALFGFQTPLWGSTEPSQGTIYLVVEEMRGNCPADCYERLVLVMSA